MQPASNKKKVHYRPQHKGLVHIKKESTKHGFEQRLVVASSSASGPVYCGVWDSQKVAEEVELTKENYRLQVELIEERARQVAERSVTIPGGSVPQRRTSSEMEFSNSYGAEAKERSQTPFSSISMSTASPYPLEYEEDVPIPADGPEVGNPIIDYYNLEHQFTFQRYGGDSTPEKIALQSDPWGEDNSHPTGPHQVYYPLNSYSLAENSRLNGTSIHTTSSGGESLHPEYWRELDSGQVLTLPHPFEDTHNGLLAQHGLYIFPR